MFSAAAHGLAIAALPVAAQGLVAGAVPALGPADTASPRRVLVHTVSAGFEHDVVRRAANGELSLVERTLVELGRASGRFEAVPSRDPAEFDPEMLARYDAVLFYTTGELPLSAAQRRALFDFVKGGKAFVGVHPATDTFYAVPEYGEMIGAWFEGHPWHEAVRVIVEEPRHAATAHLPPAFEITDEIYQFRAPYDRERVNVLLRLDADALDLARAGVHREDRDFALAWTRPFGAGRVFYTALGHRPEVWADERFQRHLVGGLRWALRDVEPVPLAAEDEVYRSFAGDHAGDPARGFGIFRRESGPMCIRCHVAHGLGTAVGPDLSRLALRSTREEIVDHVLAPSFAVDPAQRATSFELEDGTLLVGRVRTEAEGRVEVWDVEGQLRTLATADIAARRESATSLMPAGLARTLAHAEFADLVAWLATLKGS